MCNAAKYKHLDDEEHCTVPSTSSHTHAPAQGRPETSNAGKQLAITAVVCGGLSLQGALFVLLRAYLTSSTCDSVVLMYGEIMKVVVATIMAWPERRLLLERGHLALPPVVTFVIMNLLSFWSIKQLPATLSIILIQMKLVWTAVFSRIVLHRALFVPRTFALVALFLGCIAVTIDARSESAQGATVQRAPMLAVGGLLLETMLSGGTSVYMQVIFEMSAATMWRRNVQLAALSTVVYAVTAESGQCAFVPDQNGLILAVISACGGILVALSLLFSGAVGKAIATSSSIVLTIFIEHAFVLLAWPTTLSTVLCASVLNAVAMYSFLGSSA